MAEHVIVHHQKDYKSLEEIWNDLLRLHWDYLDTEENMQKLELRKTLEGTNFGQPPNCWLMILTENPSFFFFFDFFIQASWKISCASSSMIENFS